MRLYYVIRQTIKYRVVANTQSTLRSVMKKNQRPFSRQKSGGLYEKLFAISTAISGRNFGNEREAKREQLGQSVAHYTSQAKSVGSAESFCPLKNSRQTRYYTLCPTANENENQGGNHNIIFSMSHGKIS